MLNDLYKIEGKKYVLTDKGLKTLVQDYGLGYSQIKLTKKFGVSEDVIRRWMKENNIATRKRKWYVNEHYFDVIDIPEKAYWLGFLSADGYVHKERGEIQFELQESDKDQVKKLANALSYNKPLLKIIIASNQKSFTHWRLTIRCKKLTDQLEKYGIVQHKSLTFKPRNIPNQFFSYWILGYMDGDGCILNAKGRVKISFTGTLETLSLIKEYFYSTNQISLEHRCNKTYKFV